MFKQHLNSISGSFQSLFNLQVNIINTSCLFVAGVALLHLISISPNNLRSGQYSLCCVSAAMQSHIQLLYFLVPLVFSPR